MSAENKNNTCISSPFYVVRNQVKNGAQIISICNRPPQLGMFFDGTGNNMTNASKVSNDNDEPTNVAKLFITYDSDRKRSIHKEYIAGIGTASNKSDSSLDMGLATSFGDRLNDAIRRTQTFFEAFPKAPVGILDVFGFSRGAAAARAFVNEIHKINQTNPAFWGGANLVVRFTGIFDTVGSIGSPGDNDNGRFILDLHPKAAESVFHLTAYHERREYFPLSSVLTAPGNSPASHFEEIVLPGAHSDVGGGYGPVDDVVYYPLQSIQWLNGQQRQQELEKLISEMENKYHAPGIRLEPENIRDIHHAAHGPWRRTSLSFKWVRNIKPHLSHHALNKMHARAVEVGVPLQSLDILLKERSRFHGNTAEDIFLVPDDLQLHLAALEHDINSQPSADYVYKNYIHHSHQYRIKPGDIVNSNKSESDPDRTAPNGKREIFYNRIDRGHSVDDVWTRKNMGQMRHRWYRK